MTNRIDDVEVAHYEAILWGAALSIEDTINNQIDDVEAAHAEALSEEALRMKVAREKAEIAYKVAILSYWEIARREPSMEDPALEVVMTSLMELEKIFLEAYISEEIFRLDSFY